jgi:hypothetical protein
MLESLPVWAPLVVGGGLWWVSLRAGEASVYMRSWIPSWRFFENTGPVPRLEFRVAGKGDSGDWQGVQNPSGAEKARLFFSSKSNGFHAFESLVLDFALNSDHPDLESAIMEESIRRILESHPHATVVRLRLRWMDEENGVFEPVWEKTWNSPSS